MRKALFIIFALLIAIACYAEPKSYVLSIPIGTQTTVTNTFGGDKGIKGKLDTLTVSASDQAITANVAVAYTPLDGYAPNVNIATNDVVGTKTWRPRYDGTDTAGAALTSDPQDNKLILTSEQLQVIVAGSDTSVTWRVTLKMDE